MSEAAGGPQSGKAWSRTWFYGRGMTWGLGGLGTGFGRTLRVLEGVGLETGSG